MNLHLLAEVDTIGSWDAISWGILIARVVIGITMAAHGWNKFFGGGRIAGTAGWFDSMGMKPNGKVHAILAASTELGGGILFALGLLTPLAAAAIVSLMLVAAWTVHRENGFFSVKNGWELNAMIATAAVSVATTSPGKHSLDWVFGISPSFDPNVGLGVSLGLGVAAGAGLLAACYRPPAPAGDGD